MELNKNNIILFCISPINKKSNIENISLNDILNILYPFGNVIKIAIFRKNIYLKSFVEFQFISECQYTINELNGYLINNYGKIIVDIAKINKIENSQNFIEFYDKAFDKLYLNDKDISIIKTNKTFSISSINKNSISIQSLKINNKSNKNILQQSKLKNININNFKNNISEYFNNKSLIINKENKKYYLSNKSIDINSKTIKNNSNVILISNLQKFENINEIITLFKIFGNIKNILYLKNKYKAFVEYFCIKDCNNAKIFLNNLILNRYKLKVVYSKYKFISFNLFLNKNNNYFKSNIKTFHKINFHNITNKLLIYIDKNIIFDESDLYLFFKINNLNFNLINFDKNLLLIFDNKEDALFTYIKCLSKKFNNYFLNIKFTNV